MYNAILDILIYTLQIRVSWITLHLHIIIAYLILSIRNKGMCYINKSKFNIKYTIILSVIMILIIEYEILYELSKLIEIL